MAQMRITSGKGVHFTMENGVTISIQIGGGNYCDNYDEPFAPHLMDTQRRYELPPSRTAEIAAWVNFDGGMVNLGYDTVRGRVPIDEVLAFVEFLRAIPGPVTDAVLQDRVRDFKWSDDE